MNVGEEQKIRLYIKKAFVNRNSSVVLRLYLLNAVGEIRVDYYGSLGGL
jgi:hypothetical protein